MSRTVVITGMGATTPLGGDAPSTWQALKVGTSGVQALTHDWAEGLPTKIAAPCAVEPDLPRVEARRMDRVSQLAVTAALEAWGDAGFAVGEDNDVDGERLAVSCGTGIGGLQSLIGNWDVQKERGVRRVSPYAIPLLMANAPASNIGLRIGAMAGLHTPVSACASSNEALAQAADILRLGRADVVVAGGGEAVIHPFTMAGFGQMMALSRRNDEPQRASRPWDVDRDGFVLGEGAAFFVIETLEHAQARGAKIYGTIAGAGLSADSHDMVQPDPSGRGQMLAMRRALAEAEIDASSIKHVNAHATATPQGDITEAKSIRGVLGDGTEAVVTGTKSMTGHLLGGAGAMESLATVMALKDRTVPPTINLENPESDLGIDIAANTARDLPAGDLAAINNSFGFGGPNVALCFTNENVTD
ncbi:beta-ketoacyl-[acyl-carrier-protein] synthase family protein [Propioniferax innocua]|uniref:3-oxoacyl-[acyl-carrier-protein] synthase II n=1 Tax=Propioniferax innocua TaxID=1753 RepID=A0A542ZQR9_9ACTN|nr:beta-ketoacyl-[acyl-carrier-protein] synthase family protein [Propioniferax innocua]TQL62703.1 3-oxoacyl-[acyl-carrier-protein] synthase II [Propioniferax innocua]